MKNNIFKIENEIIENQVVLEENLYGYCHLECHR